LLRILHGRTMTKTARVNKIEMLTHNRGQVGFKTLPDELEASSATLKRNLDDLNDRLGAPIEYDRLLNGYRFGQGHRSQKHALQGLWFSERDLYSLLTAPPLLSDGDSDAVISRRLQPVRVRIHEMLGADESDARALLKPAKNVCAAKRPVPTQSLEMVGEALLRRRRLHMRYLTGGLGAASDQS
jgi:predicted DNA-binding transcriptional regulator YafY